MAGGKSGIYLHRSTTMDIKRSLPKGAKTNVERLAIILEQFMWMCNSSPLREIARTREDWQFAFPWLSKIQIREAFYELVFLGYLESRPICDAKGNQGTAYSPTGKSSELFPSDSHPAPQATTLVATCDDPSSPDATGSAPDTLFVLKTEEKNISVGSDDPPAKIKYTPEELSLAEDFILRTKNYLIGEQGRMWIQELSAATLASGMHKSGLNLGELEAAFDFALETPRLWNLILNHWAFNTGKKWREVYNQVR